MNIHYMTVGIPFYRLESLVMSQATMKIDRDVLADLRELAISFPDVLA